MAFCKKIKAQYITVKDSAAIKSINKTIVSPWGVGILGALTVLAFAFSLEIVFYTIVVLYASYVGLFADDLAPIIPLFILCYVTPSISNNPGKSDQGLFYGASGIYLACIVTVGVLILLLRVALDKDFGIRRLFTMKRSLLIGMIALGASYFLSGIGHERYFENVTGNLLFAFIQFASVILLYFILSVAIKWDQFDLDYFAWAGLIMGLVVAAEVGCIYIINDVVINGAIFRGNIYSGWGCYNNIGAIISMSIPFAFYFACHEKKRSSIFLVIAFILLVAVVCSGSRGSMVGAILAFAASFIYTFIKCTNKKEFRIAGLVLLGVVVIGSLIFNEQLSRIFSQVPHVAYLDNGSLGVNDSGRLDIYMSGLKVFLNHPIFGQSFYPLDFELYGFSEVEQFTSFFPHRWHNTVVQMLASCGAVGMLAYSYHRIDTIRLYIRKRNLLNTYIAFFILTLLVMSLLDCHFFNVGPVLFYSIALAVMEFGKEPAKKQKQK